MDWIGAQLSDIDAEFKTALMLKNRFNLLFNNNNNNNIIRNCPDQLKPISNPI
jgi:hypothetical protein